MAPAEEFRPVLKSMNLNFATLQGSITFCGPSPIEMGEEASPAPHLLDMKGEPLHPWIKSQNPPDFLFSKIFATGRRMPSLSSSLYPEWCSSNKKALLVHKKGRRKLNCINFKLY